GLEGRRFRRLAEGVLLRARDRDPDPALDRLRRQALREQGAARDTDDHHRARVHRPDLVHALARRLPRQPARSDPPSLSSPPAAIQLPATRTAIRAQGSRIVTTSAAPIATATKSVVTMPTRPAGPGGGGRAG